MHGTRLVRTAVAALVLAATPLLGTIPAGANTLGPEGCTPGYWKNHHDAWNDNETDSYSPDQLVGDVFDVPFPDLADDTLLDALRYKGGPGLEGMARNLLRQSVAAILNVSVDGVAYPYYLHPQGGVIGVIDETNTALASGSRSAMEAVKNLWEAANELGCPL